MIDLFGNPILDSEMPTHLEVAKKRYICKGYASVPGSGPKGEHCSSCEFAVKRNRFWKCYLRRKTWSACITTDIRLKSPACRYWQLHKLTVFRIAK